MRESRQQFQVLVETLYDWVWEVDSQGHYTYVSPQIKNILGYEVQEILGKSPFDLMPSQEARNVSEKFGALIKEQKPIIALENVNFHKDGRLIVLETNGLPFYDVDGKFKGYRGTDRDITARKQTEEQIKHFATHDLLTDLPGMRLAKDRLSVALNMAHRHKKAVAVMFIDLDGFKVVNDTLGHDAGDFMLKQVAQRMLSCVRETDTVARVGGDEFLIIATEIHAPENAAQIAEKVIRTISKPVIFNEQQAVVGASIGIALFPDHGEDMDKLIKLADEVMYKVKNAGKNGFRFVNATTK